MITLLTLLAVLIAGMFLATMSAALITMHGEQNDEGHDGFQSVRHQSSYWN
ncbi:MAG: hypothetical protein P1V13_12590 [Rhizobiaceae bacterium]|nr:hypothetical protein [Rhizobiaceae bacterium]